MWAETTLESLRKQVELYQRAAAYKASARERIVALGEADEICFYLHPHHYRTWQIVRIASQKGRCVGGREQEIEQCELRLISTVMDVILDGLKNHEFSLGGVTSPGELALMIWVLALGTRALMDAKLAIRNLERADGLQISCRIADTLLDALGWRPLSGEVDYAAARQNIRRQLFAAEMMEIEQGAAAGKVPAATA